MAARTLKLNVDGKEVAASLESKIGKDDLYGRVDQTDQNRPHLQPLKPTIRNRRKKQTKFNRE